ncbi:MAG: hypothetical protein JXR31_02515 [Prolixibacteraceae bacterium]|nr:hypothetical protein [Prolixibacteraceae bacterium]MBN2773096.1 hypothetical protein [Prolixibacteraceae bacterium]
MDISVAITGMVLLSAFIIPVIIININSKKKAKGKINRLKSQFLLLGLEPGEYDLWNTYMIGADSQKNIVVYISGDNDHQDVKIIELLQVKKCEVRNSSHLAETKTGNQPVSDSVGLMISFRDEKRESTYLEFFNAEKEAQLDTELILAKKWVEIMNQKTGKVRNIPHYRKVV